MKMTKSTLLMIGTVGCLSACFSSFLPDSEKSDQAQANNPPQTEEAVVVAVQTNPNETMTSLDLNVSPKFMFNNVQMVDFTIEAVDGHNNALNDRFISVFSVPENLTFWSDEFAGDAHLIFKAKTDATGQLSRQVELPGEVKQVLLVLSYIGQKNKELVNINQGGVSHRFK